MTTPKQITAPITIGTQGIGNISIGSITNRIVLPGLTLSKPLNLDALGRIYSGDYNIVDISPGSNNSVLSSIVGTTIWSTSLFFSSIDMTVPIEFSISGVPGTAPTTSIIITKNSQSANLFYSSPFPIPGVPLFQNITNNSLPIITISKGGTSSNIIGGIGAVLYSNGSSITYTNVGTSGQILTNVGSGIVQWQTLGGVGTVTSISANDNSTGLLLSTNPNPITTTGSLNLTGILNPNNGGFGINGSTFVSGNTFYSNGPNNISTLPVGIDGDILTINSNLPSWDTPVGGGTINNISVNTIGGLLNPNVTNPAGPNTVIDLTLVSQLQNRVFASPDGIFGVPTFRSLLNNDLPIINITKGGTGLSSVGPSESILFSNGSNLSYNLSPGSPGQVLISTGATPTWTTIGGGTIFSVGFNTGTTGLIVNSTTTNPITNTGTFTLSGILNTNSGGTGLSGPFINGDILYYSGGTFNLLPPGSINQVLTISGGLPIWNNPIGTGTLTSIDLTLSTNLSSIFNVSGSPVSGAGGTFTLDLDTQNANILLTGPEIGGPSPPTFRNITNTDLPLVPINKGGTNSTSAPVSGEIVFGNGTDYNFTNSNIAGQILTSNGSGAPTWTSLSGVGTVTSVDGSGGITGFTFTGGPITTSGTLTIGSVLNIVSGGTNLTSFNQGDILYASAIDTLSSLPISGSGNVLTVSLGNVAWLPLPGVGTVTSIGLSAPSIFTVAGSPVIGAGTLTFSLNNQNANTIFAGPNSGGPVVPTFKSLVSNDLPIIDIAHGGTNSNTSLAGDRIMISNSTSIIELSPVGISTQVLSSDGPGLPPTWRTIGIGGTVTSVSGIAGSTGLVIATSPNPITNTGSVNIASGTLLEIFGGTGQNIFSIGDILYSDTITTLSKRNIGSNGQVLSIVGGVPIWSSPSSIGIVTNVSASLPLSSTGGATPNISVTGIIPITNGGTNSGTILNNNRLMVSSTGSIIELSSGGTLGQILTSGGAGLPIWSDISSITVSSFSGGTTGLTPNVPTTGAVVLSGILGTSNGGTNTSALEKAGTVAFSNGTFYTFTPVGVSNQVLISNGSSSPSWSTLTAGPGISIVNGVGTKTISASSFTKPVLTQNTFATTVDQTSSLNVLANDTFPNPFASMLVTTTLDPIKEGSFSSLTTNPLTFTPVARALGPMIFGYEAVDNLGRKSDTLCKINTTTSVSTNNLLVTYGASNTVSILNVNTGASSILFTVPFTCIEIAFNRRDNLLYYSSAGTGPIYAYDILSGFNFTLVNNTSSIGMSGTSIRTLGYDQQNGIFYIGADTGAASTVIGCLNMQPYNRSTPGVQLYSSSTRTYSFSVINQISVDPSSGLLYCSCDTTLYIVDRYGTFNLLASGLPAVFHGNFTSNGFFYGANISNQIRRYNTNNWTPLTLVSIPSVPFDMADVPYGY